MKILNFHIKSIWSGNLSVAGLIGVAILIFGTMTSCTSSSQIPLTVRQQQDRQLVDITAREAAVESDLPEPGMDEEQLRRLEEELQLIAETMEIDFRNRANDVLALYLQAQTGFYNGNNNQALQDIRSALEIHETADLHALKGAVFYRLGQQEESDSHWRRAVELNPDVVSDMYPGMKIWYERNP